MPIHRVRITALIAAIAMTVGLAGCEAAPAARPTRPEATSTATPLATFGTLSTTPLSPARSDGLQRALDSSGYPDALATVITHDGIWSGASGVDGPNGRKAAPGDVFSIASVTKTFTAALVFKLVEAGKMQLDAPLSRYLDPDAAKKSNGATVRQALGMRSGIPDTPDTVREAALAVPDHLATVAGIVATMPAPVGKPGQETRESNPTYKLLALAAERAAGAKWADLVRTELVARASVPGTLLVQQPGTRTPGTWALPTTDGPWGIGGTLPFVADTSFSHGATDMAADTRSLATWFWALLSGRIVSARSLAAMAADDGTGTGSGLDPYTDGGLPPGTIGHGGNKPGFHTMAVAIPSKQTVIVVAISDDDGTLDDVALGLLGALG